MQRIINAPIISNDQSFERLLSISVPVIFLFWNGRGIPDDLNQTILNLASDEAGDLIIAKINSADNPQAVRHFDVTRTPLLIGLQDGREVFRLHDPNLMAFKQETRRLLREQGADMPGGQEDHTGGRTDEGTGHGHTVGRNVESRPVYVSDAEFEDKVLRSSIPVLVDFWAPWCGPCHMLAPVLDKLARDYAGRLRIVKVNVDKNPHYAGTFGVQGIPTLLMIRDGRLVDKLVGAMPEQYLRAKIEQQLL